MAAKPASGLLSKDARHLVGRFAYGVTPGVAQEVGARGGATAWFTWQLQPSKIADPDADVLWSWFPRLQWSPSQVWSETINGNEGDAHTMIDYQNWLLLRRMRSRRQVLETMTEFWENHFNVPVGADGVATWRVPYGDVIRANALGSFESLLKAVTTHPAMGIYLMNAVSDKEHPNENQGRELLELHSVGIEAGYSEMDVVNSARILTGYRVDLWNTWAASYDQASHYTGPVQVLGFSSPNSSSDGRSVTQDYLRYLAHHPATARHIATRLATAFVSDNPSASLVTTLADVYLANNTNIKPVLQALVSSPEFAGSHDAKIRDPENDLVASYRLMGISIGPPTAPNSAANQLVWQAETAGMNPMSWPAPNGRPIVGSAWCAPSRVMGSMLEHYIMSARWFPDRDIAFPTAASWLPSPSTRFDQLVDHMSRLILHRPASPTLLTACSQAVATQPLEQVSAQHPAIKWIFARLLTTFFDSPDFLRR